MKTLKKQLIELLNIHGVSGEEGLVREYLTPVLSELMDKVFVDKYGNLLGEKKIGSGSGATVLLSAHMDTVKGVLKERKLIDNNGSITSDIGALGADDRAGIAVILSVLRNIGKTSFEGKIKVAFTREEEVGCRGVSEIDKVWLLDVNLAIVADRKGNRDIVVGCGEAFCCDEVGDFMENCSELISMNYKCVEGGISDATTFSQNGINSVNLSVGYYNEHTDREYVVVDDMKDTVRLILQALSQINEHVGTFTKVPEENKWVKSWARTWDKTPRGFKDKTIFHPQFKEELEDVYIEEYDVNGDVYMYEVGENIVILQGNQEVVLNRKTLRGIVEQLIDVV